MSIFELPNNLKSKSIKPAGRAQSPKTKPVAAQPATQQTAPSNNPQDLERLAMEAMSDLAAKFPAWASGDVQKIKQYLAEASGTFDEERTTIIRQRVYPKAHDLKGQGTTFGYPLITDIGSHMCKLMTSKTTFSSSDIGILKNDANMMETVLWKKLKGDGGVKGAQILEKLK